MMPTHPASAIRCAVKSVAPGVRAGAGASLGTQGLQVVLWVVVLALSPRAEAAVTADGDLAQRIQRGESFLTNLFDTRLQLLPECRGSSTYWLFHDNYLAAHSDPDAPGPEPSDPFQPGAVWCHQVREDRNCL